MDLLAQPRLLVVVLSLVFSSNLMMHALVLSSVLVITADKGPLVYELDPAAYPLHEMVCPYTIGLLIYNMMTFTKRELRKIRRNVPDMTLQRFNMMKRLLHYV